MNDLKYEQSSQLEIYNILIDSSFHRKKEKRVDITTILVGTIWSKNMQRHQPDSRQVIYSRLMATVGILGTAWQGI